MQILLTEPNYKQPFRQDIFENTIHDILIRPPNRKIFNSMYIQLL